MSVGIFCTTCPTIVTMANNKFYGREADSPGRTANQSQTHDSPGEPKMSLTGVKTSAMLLWICATIAGCSGGGGSVGTAQPSATPTTQPTPSPSPTATGIIGPLGPVVASWKGEGSYSAQSDAAWPITFIPLPGDPLGSYTNGPPIVFTAVGQSVIVSLSQSNYTGLLPTLATFVGSCTGIFGVATGPAQMRVSYSSVGSSGCNLQLDGARNGSYQGAAALLHIVVPSAN